MLMRTTRETHRTRRCVGATARRTNAPMQRRAEQAEPRVERRRHEQSKQRPASTTIPHRSTTARRSGGSRAEPHAATQRSEASEQRGGAQQREATGEDRKRRKQLHTDAKEEEAERKKKSREFAHAGAVNAPQQSKARGHTTKRMMYHDQQVKRRLSYTAHPNACDKADEASCSHDRSRHLLVPRPTTRWTN